jgi:hypothetical protein
MKATQEQSVAEIKALRGRMLELTRKINQFEELSNLNEWEDYSCENTVRCTLLMCLLLFRLARLCQCDAEPLLA